MAKEAVLWVFGYRLCPNCRLFSSSGWFDDAGVWYCEECQVNCILDLFDEGFGVEEEEWLLLRGARYAASLPLAAGRMLALAALRGTRAAASAALSAAAARLLARSSGDGAKAPQGGALTAEVFDSPWQVVDGHEVGDLVEVDGVHKNLRERRAG